MCTAARRTAGVSKVQTSAACSLVLYCARDRASMSWPVVGSCTTLCFVSPWPCAQPMPALRVNYKHTAAATSYPERPVRLARGGRGRGAHARIDGQGWQPQDRKLQPMVPARGAHGQCLVSPCALVSQPRRTRPSLYWRPVAGSGTVAVSPLCVKATNSLVWSLAPCLALARPDAAHSLLFRPSRWTSDLLYAGNKL